MARKKVITCESCGTREYMEKSIEVELKQEIRFTSAVNIVRMLQVMKKSLIKKSFQ